MPLVREHAKTCECPLCPLIQANARFCDFLIRFERDDFVKISLPEKHADTPNDLVKCIVLLARDLYKRCECRVKQKIGESYDLEEEEYEFFMKRVTKTAWKICFHTKTKTTVIDEDPQ